MIPDSSSSLDEFTEKLTDFYMHMDTHTHFHKRGFVHK